VIFNNIGVLEEYKENSSENLRFNIKVQQVTAKQDNQVTFELPDGIGYNTKFLAFAGSLSLDEEGMRYLTIAKTCLYKGQVLFTIKKKRTADASRYHSPHCHYWPRL